MRRIGIRALQALCFGCLGIMLFSTAAFAYIDPATTAYVIQIIAGVFIACGVAVGVFWQKIRLWFQKNKIKTLEKKLEKKASKNAVVISADKEAVKSNTEIM